MDRKRSLKRILAGVMALSMISGLMPGTQSGMLEWGGVKVSAKDPGMTVGESYTIDEIKEKMLGGAYCYLATYDLPDEAFNVDYNKLENDYKDYLLGMQEKNQ